MLDKYVKINEKVIESKQTSGGVWYCSSVTSETPKEMDGLIGELNKIYNKYNKKEKSVPATPKEKQADKLDNVRMQSINT